MHLLYCCPYFPRDSSDSSSWFACTACYLLSGNDVRNGVCEGDNLLNLLHGKSEDVPTDLFGEALFARQVPGHELQRAGGLHPDVTAACFLFVR